jgi:DNA-binding NarL/FixJ family response regulator
MNEITILLADDHTVVRQGLKAFLNLEPGLKVVGEAADGQQAVQMARKLKPNVIIMDIGMPVLNGLEATRAICGEDPEARVIVLSSHNDDEYIEGLTGAGAIGYLLKQTAPKDLVTGIRDAHAGNVCFSPSISRRMAENCRRAFISGRPVAKAGEELKGRELEILQLIAAGKTNKDMAVQLAISVKTVEKHRQQLMERLRIHDIAGLTRYAVGKGIADARPALDPDLRRFSAEADVSS